MNNPDGLDRLVSHVTETLPNLNVRCRDGAEPMDSWIAANRPVIDGCLAAAAPPARKRMRLLQALGFILASGERHAQAVGHAPGWIVGQLPSLEAALARAAGSDRLPVLTAELYWERNDCQPPMSFAGEPYEHFFISAVRTQTALRAVVNRQIRALLDGHWDPAAPEGARMLRAATASMAEAHGQYLDFRHGPDGAALMTPAQFNEMRAWLASTVIGNRTLAGANAAYIPDMVVTDFLLGTADDEYSDYVRSFDSYQSPAGRRLITQDRTRTPLTLVLARALGMSAEAFDTASLQDVACAVSKGLCSERCFRPDTPG